MMDLVIFKINTLAGRLSCNDLSLSICLLWPQQTVLPYQISSLILVQQILNWPRKYITKNVFFFNFYFAKILLNSSVSIEKDVTRYNPIICFIQLFEMFCSFSHSIIYSFLRCWDVPSSVLLTPLSPTPFIT